MSIGSDERALGMALKDLPVDGLVRSFPPSEEILRCGRQRRARRRASLAGSCATAVFLTAVSVGALDGPAKPSRQTVSSASASIDTWATRGDLANDPRLGPTKAAWERARAQNVHVLFAGHLPGLNTPLVVLSNHVGDADTVRLVEWRANDQDAVLDKGSTLPPGREYITVGVSDVGNQLAFTYGPDGKPNTPVTHVGAVHVLVLTSPGPHRVEFIGEENPSPLGATGDGVFTGSFSTTRPAAVAFNGEDPRPLDFLVQA